MNRPFAITIAAIVTLLHSLYSIVFTLPLLARGASAAAEASDSPPYFILVLGLVIGVLGLVATWGLWNNQRWGKILAIAVMAINGLSALPGVFFAPSSSLRVTAIFGVAVGVATIVLVLWPTRQNATVRP